MALPAVIGAVAPYAVPAIAGLLGGLFSGRSKGGSQQSSPTGLPGTTHQFQRFTPAQQSALDQLLQQGLSGIQNNQFDFAPIREQATRQFHSDIVPTLAERFTALGGSGTSLGSSALQGALGAAGAGLAGDLAAQQSKYNLAREGNLMNLLNLGLTPRFENVHNAPQPGFGENALMGLIQSGSLPDILKLLTSLGGQPGGQETNDIASNIGQLTSSYARAAQPKIPQLNIAQKLGTPGYGVGGVNAAGPLNGLGVLPPFAQKLGKPGWMLS